MKISPKSVSGRLYDPAITEPLRLKLIVFPPRTLPLNRRSSTGRGMSRYFASSYPVSRRMLPIRSSLLPSQADYSCVPAQIHCFYSDKIILSHTRPVHRRTFSQESETADAEHGKSESTFGILDTPQNPPPHILN